MTLNETFGKKVRIPFVEEVKIDDDDDEPPL